MSNKSNNVAELGPEKQKKATVSGRKFVGAALATALLLSSCANYSKDHFVVGSVPDDYRTRHPIIVSQSEKAVDILVTTGSKGLTYRDRGVVKAAALSFRKSNSEKIAILVPTGSHNSRAAGAVAAAAARELQNSGVPRNSILVQHYNASHHGDSATVRLVHASLEASVESKCGSWEEDIADTSQNKNYSNFGCATQNNLASMIANPADLLAPRGVGDIDATRRSNVINTWRSEGSN